MKHRRLYMAVASAIWLAAATPHAAKAQATSTESLAAARELVSAMHMNDQATALLPIILKNLRPTIVQGRAEVALQYDALIPKFTQAFQGRVAEFSDAIAVVYARNFSADDLRTMAEFYRTSTGQRVLQKLPSVTQESSIAGQRFGQALGEEIRKQMVEELRKKGLDL
ncbi:conserved exported hypothetical protein [Bradyrhizobium oligotrophicum S58]|uniref:DUF2059 domain-containing protein n=1 Tax=Bradyrhizobium oligotrophicum S58 TaxID=1245469 RepID=M4Z0W8_9BRAD|nr:DUF2059 domain-containing protein [Bradyrhizobium oligotrophicum]BAM86327.1 conserved exported hypothetical protein [Bradyrhizobium oligotrophicum S58]